MGADIHSFAERRENGKWQKIKDKIFGEKTSYSNLTDSPFDWRSYSMFAFFADVRNYDHCEPISECKGLPNDSEYLNTPLEKPCGFNYGYFDNGIAETEGEYISKDADYHSKSWLTLKELLDFDYDKTFWNRRISRTIYRADGSVGGSNGACLAEEGEGEIVSYRNNLGEGYFKELEVLKTLGKPEDVRIVFWFDN